MNINNKIALFAIFLIFYFVTSAHAELKFLSVLFRHGDRAPDNNGFEIYPKDPHANHTFEPMGFGGLTNEGKRRQFNLGAYIRRLYGNFLSDVYYPWEVKARSTKVGRTIMSLQLVLAGLYPPHNIQKWKDDLDWQPIPTAYENSLDDILMFPIDCPRYLRAREQVENSPEFQAKLKTFENLMHNLTIETGRPVVNSKDMYFLYHTFMSEKSMNLCLPRWTTGIFPYGKLHDGITLEYELFSYTTEMRRLNGGMLLRKFTDDMTNHKNKVLDGKYKLSLYSGHETNIVAVLQALGVYKPHVPEYSSALFVELHEENGKYYVKVKYYKGIPSEHEEIVIPGCETDCTLDKFKEVLKDVIPSDDELHCDKRSLRHVLENNSIKIPSAIIQMILSDIKKEEAMRHVLK